MSKHAVFMFSFLSIAGPLVCNFSIILYIHKERPKVILFLAELLDILLPQADSSLLFHFTGQHHQIQLSTYYLPFTWLPKMPNHHTSILKMATEMSSKTLDNFQLQYGSTPKAKAVHRP
jgi:hypothetical protein